MDTLAVPLAKLQAALPELQEQFRSGTPFPHVLFDDLVDPDVLRQVASEFPEEGWRQYDKPEELKQATEDESKMGPTTRSLLHELNSQPVMQLFSAVTGIDGLLCDPYLRGGGLHQIQRDGFLKIHNDFSTNPDIKLDRRLNLIIYLNEEWDDSYGGHFEMWDRSMSGCLKKVAPRFGTALLFATTDHSPHGHPEPLTCPPERSRRSLALYYYTNGRPDGEVDTAHHTQWFERPGEAFESPRDKAIRVAKLWVPPIAWTEAKKLKKRLLP